MNENISVRQTVESVASLYELVVRTLDSVEDTFTLDLGEMADEQADEQLEALNTIQHQIAEMYDEENQELRADHRYVYQVVQELQIKMARLFKGTENTLHEDSEQMLEERLDENLRQEVAKITSTLHYCFSQIDRWHATIERIKKYDDRNFTSFQFLSFMLERALSEYMKKNASLLEPEALLKFLQSENGRLEISETVLQMLRNDEEVEKDFLKRNFRK